MPRPFGVASVLRVRSVIRVNHDMPQALFLDRDGTLIEWVHYLHDPDEVVLTEGVAEALKLAKKAGCRLFMHTNQSGVGRGYFTMKEVNAVNRRMYELLGIDESFFDDICIATDVPSDAKIDSYRKPNSRFEREMVAKYELNLRACYMIGDSVCDVETGVAAGMESIAIIGGVCSSEKRQALRKLSLSQFKSLAVCLNTFFPNS